VLKKQKKPTIVKLKSSLLQETSGLKKLAGKALLEPKKSSRENIISTNRTKVHGGTGSSLHKTQASDKIPKFKKSMITINNFRREIEDFHLAHSLSTRTGGLFKPFLDKGALTTTKSISPPLNLLSSSRTGLSSMRLLNSDFSPKLKTKFLMSLSKDLKQSQVVPESPQPTEKLISIRSSGKVKEKSIEKSETTRSKVAFSKDLDLQAPWISQKRKSFAPSSSGNRDFILIKRLKSEDKGNTEKATFEQKPSSTSKFNVGSKKLSIGETTTATKSKADIKSVHQKQFSTSKAEKSPGMGFSRQRTLSSFRGRSKVTSLNIN
jgi:hypothetical protein